MKNYNEYSETEKQSLLEKYYIKDQLSIQQIAEMYHLYPNKIRRDLKKYNIDIRTKSDAQKNALKKGTHQHPTKGKKRSEETKQKIGESIITTI